MEAIKAALVALLLIASVNSVTIQEQRQMMVGIAQECKASTGASDNDLSMLILKKPMTTREGKCLMFCIMENLGIIDGPTRTLKKDEFREYVSVPAKGKQDIISKMEDIADKCTVVTDPDSCEMAFKSAACLKSGMAEAKIKIDIGI